MMMTLCVLCCVFRQAVNVGECGLCQDMYDKSSSFDKT